MGDAGEQEQFILPGKRTELRRRRGPLGVDCGRFFFLLLYAFMGFLYLHKPKK